MPWIAADPDGAEQRHRQARRDRRVVITPEADGMASLWALLTATQAAGAFTLATLGWPAASGPTTPAAWTPAAPTSSPHCSAVTSSATPRRLPVRARPTAAGPIPATVRPPADHPTAPAAFTDSDGDGGNLADSTRSAPVRAARSFR